jgi:hypothetical protein
LEGQTAGLVPAVVDFENSSSFAFAEGDIQAQYFGDPKFHKIWMVHLQNAEKFQEVLDYIRTAMKGK